jgi:hypothetical protein
MRHKIEFIDGKDLYVEGDLIKDDDNTALLVVHNDSVLESHFITNIKSVYYNV